LLGETLEPWREGLGPTGSPLGKGPIESIYFKIRELEDETTKFSIAKILSVYVKF